MINPTHPATAHISAVRAWRFAQELAKLGHRVVLLTATHADSKPELRVDRQHNWQLPFVLACARASRSAPQGSRRLRSAQRVRTALRMVMHGGEAKAWLQAAIHASSALPVECRPDVVWCTFGQMEAVFAARRIARALQVPWVLDVKDNWELYVPRGIRRLMAWRTSGFVAATSNAQFTQRIARKWQRVDAQIIYSGVEDCFLSRDDEMPASDFEINLVGAIYYPAFLRELMTGIGRWYRDLTEPQRHIVKFRYLGAQTELVLHVAGEVMPELTPERPGYVYSSTMARMCQRASVNCYTAHPGTFHHKLLELLACGRPVLVCPSETEEAIGLGSPVTGQLNIAATSDDVVAVLERVSTPFFERKEPQRPFSREHLVHFDWSVQARQLEQVLRNVVRG